MDKYSKEFFKQSGAKGGKQKGVNYRKFLLEELSKVCTKQELNFYQEVAKKDYSGKLLREAWMLKLKK